MAIRILVLLLVLGLSLTTSCNNDDDDLRIEFESSAIILGPDPGFCACCGGWIINIDGQDTDNRFIDLPENSNIDLENATFPISVQLNWSEDDSYCGKGIIIEAIE